MPDETPTPENDEPSGNAEPEGTSHAASGSIDQSEIDALAAELDGLTGGTKPDGSPDADTAEPSAGSESQADPGPDSDRPGREDSSVAENAGTIAHSAQLNAAIEVAGDDQSAAGGVEPAEQAVAAPTDKSETAGPASNAIDQNELDRLTAELKQQTEQGGPATDTTEGVAGSAPPAKGTVSHGSDELSTVANELAAEIDATVAAGQGDADDGENDLAAEMAAVIAAEAAQAVAAAATTSESAAAVAASPFEAPDLAADTAEADLASIEMLDDVELDVTIELGRTDMYIEDVLQLGVGSVVQLDKAAGDPVDIYVNSRLIARGEVLVLNENFCVRINDILSPIPELDGE